MMKQAHVMPRTSFAVYLLDGRRLLQVERTGNRVFSGSDIYTAISDDAKMTNAEGRSQGFFDIFYRVEVMKAGCIILKVCCGSSPQEPSARWSSRMFRWRAWPQRYSA
jgi:hypothetical protein